MNFLLLASETSEIQPLPLIFSAVGLVAVIAVLAFLCDTSGYAIDTKCIAFAGVSLALSVGLSFVKLFELPQGGSVTLASLFPVLLFSYIYGTKKGVLVGMILGFINLAVDPYIVHPAQLLLDYPVAFAAIGLSGVFGKIKPLHKIPQLEFALGSIVAGILRFASHVLSGVFAFSAFATTEVWAYSLGYNSFVFVDIAISIAAGVLALSSKPLLALVLKKRNAAIKKNYETTENVTDNSTAKPEQTETANASAPSDANDANLSDK